MNKPSPKTLLPLAVVAVGALAGIGLIAVQPGVATREAIPSPPVVRVIEARPESHTLHIKAQGSVVPRTESELVAEVAGRIEWVSPSLASGGFIEADELSAALRLMWRARK